MDCRVLGLGLKLTGLIYDIAASCTIVLGDAFANPFWRG